MPCIHCGRDLTDDEIALHKRLINRGADKFLCLSCLAEYFSCTEELLRDKIAYFRSIGCMLFKMEK